MRYSKKFFFVFLFSFLQANAQVNNLPHLEKRGQAIQLIVQGQPYLVLGGELLNSSSSNAAYMRLIWSRLKAMHLNTALAAVYWELLEPAEGKFDFSLVDSVLVQARSNDMKLILLWFGTWKNGLSHYAPEWVKRDSKRFPRMHINGNQAVEAISPVSVEAMQADANAFAALMKHLKQADGAEQTVLMIQVENEVGLIGGPRDMGAEANKKYDAAVPVALMNYLQTKRGSLLPELQQLWQQNQQKQSGTWMEIFGNTPAGQETFMAWHYAQFINKVVAAGKAEYALPMFVNAWIVQPEDKGPGDYPSGGPQAHVHDIWRAGAPQVDLLSPDIYLPAFDTITALYSRSGNALFIPESRGDVNGAANAFYAIGQHSAIGYSPFGIDRGSDTNKAAMIKAYALLEQLSAEILAAQSAGTIRGIWLNPKQREQKVKLGTYTATVNLRYSERRPTALPEAGYGIIIQKGPDEFIIAGKDIQMTFSTADKGPPYVGYASIDEGKYKEGTWIAGRRLNGDDIMHSYHLSDEAANGRTGAVIRFSGDEPGIYHVKLYRFN